MQLINNILATSKDETVELMQFLILNKIEGRYNLDFSNPENIVISEPTKMPVNDGVEPNPTPKIISLTLK